MNRELDSEHPVLLHREKLDAEFIRAVFLSLVAHLAIFVVVVISVWIGGWRTVQPAAVTYTVGLVSLEEGSPLMIYTQKLASRLAGIMPREKVEIGMRYGDPSIFSGLERLMREGVENLTIIPLYPQFSHTTTSSIYDAVDLALDELGWKPEQVRISDYFDNRAWVVAIADSIREFQHHHGKPEKLLFSLHGIPQRYVAEGDPYQEHCEQSVRAVVAELGLESDEWVLAYQSRVGREPWLQPYTDETLKALAGDGVRHVQVLCPGFAVDCLETLEEIAMQNREFFEEAGGEKLEYIPALNDSEAHARVMQDLLTHST